MIYDFLAHFFTEGEVLTIPLILLKKLQQVTLALALDELLVHLILFNLVVEVVDASLRVSALLTTQAMHLSLELLQVKLGSL